MADTGWVIASSSSNDAGIGTAAWTDEGNVTTEDSFTAYVSLSGGEISNYIIPAFSLSIPGGSTIDGIEFKGVSFGGFTVYDYAIRAVKGGSVGSTDRSSVTHWNGATEIIWGTTSDLWGETWTVAQANAIAVAISCRAVGKFGGTGSIDAVYARITYTAGGGGGSATSMLSLLGVG